MLDKKQYEEDLKRRQEEHLNRVYNRENEYFQPCMHDACPNCLGTGVGKDGGSCIHMISCPCPKCKPYFISN